MDLAINTQGAYLHVKDGIFEVVIRQKENKERQKHYFAVHKIRTILLSVGTAMSTAAIRLAVQNNIDIVFLENNGKPIGRVWHSKLGSTTKIRKKQLQVSVSEQGVALTKEWICQKMENQKEFIQSLQKHRPHYQEFLQAKIQQIEALQTSVQALQAIQVQQIAEILRGLEGTAGRLYFETLSYVLPTEYQFKGRSARPAQDAFNAFLNYAYGVLYSKVERALIIAGLDPYVGFLHRDDYNQLSFVFDFIEPFRIYADTVVFRLFSAKKVNKSHTDQVPNGVSLNKEGKALLMQHFSDFLDKDSIRYKGKNQTRSNIIQYEAHALAQRLLEIEI